MDEHTHSDQCYANADADVETSAVWENTLPDDSELTGIWSEDLLLVAKSQLGYHESTQNYKVSDGERKGYTRYGAWYGIPYGDWCAMYVSFCLHYAGIPTKDVPADASCPAWVDELSKRGMYHDDPGAYEPKAGDLIFFYHGSAKKDADHVGIVTEVKDDCVYTIEGNSGDCVAERSYPVSDSSIAGYMELPENSDLTGKAEE